MEIYMGCEVNVGIYICTCICNVNERWSCQNVDICVVHIRIYILRNIYIQGDVNISVDVWNGYKLLMCYYAVSIRFR